MVPTFSGRQTKHRASERAIHLSYALRCILQELGNFILDVFDFVEPQTHIGHNEDVAGLGVFVDQHRTVFRLVGLNLFQDSLPFEHHRKNVTCVRVRRVVLRQESSQDIFSVFLP
jgi:hypothetical protein